MILRVLPVPTGADDADDAAPAGAHDASPALVRGFNRDAPVTSIPRPIVMEMPVRGFADDLNHVSSFAIEDHTGGQFVDCLDVVALVAIGMPPGSCPGINPLH